MSNMVSQQASEHFLQLIKRLYDKRDELLSSSTRLVDCSYKLENCDDAELYGIRAEIGKEMNKIISNINELAPHLRNKQIVESVSVQISILSIQLERLALESGILSSTLKTQLAIGLRNGLCQIANMTQLNPTPKTIKKAYGVVVGAHDIKLFYEHQQDNY
jgi:hypothetical protein